MLVYQRVLQQQGAFGTSSLRHRMMFRGVLQSIAYTRGNACLISNVGVHSSPSHQTHISICGLDLWDSREWPDWDWKLFFLNVNSMVIQEESKTTKKHTQTIQNQYTKPDNDKRKTIHNWPHQFPTKPTIVAPVAPARAMNLKQDSTSGFHGSMG